MLQQRALELEVFWVHVSRRGCLPNLSSRATLFQSLLCTASKSHHTADSMVIHFRVLWFSDGPVILFSTLLSAYRFC